MVKKTSQILDKGWIIYDFLKIMDEIEIENEKEIEIMK
jgi:hypothetical protein